MANYPNEQYWLTADAYNEILEILQEGGFSQQQINTFIGYFDVNNDGYYHLNGNLVDYESFLDNLLGAGEWEGTVFVGWADYTPGTSGQGGGAFKITF